VPSTVEITRSNCSESGSTQKAGSSWTEACADMEGPRTPAGGQATPSAEAHTRFSTAQDMAAQVKSPMTPNTEALVERNLAEKQRLLAQLREKAQALEEQITRDSDRLSTARSGRRIRTALVGADSFTPRPQTGKL
jgi:hypothetical protein